MSPNTCNPSPRSGHTLGATDAASFDIVGASGQLQTKAALDSETRTSYSVTVAVRDAKDIHGNPDTTTDDTITVSISVTTEDEAPAPPGGIGATPAATTTELPGDRLLIQRHDVPDASLEVAVGSISADGTTVVMAGVIRDETLGQTYLVVRRESDGWIVRRWVPPDSPLVYQIPWAVVNTLYTVPVGVVGAIPLDDQFPEPNLLVRRFDGGDDRIFGYDGTLGKWRHVPDITTFQALGFYWCNVTAADAAFFERITPGPPHPASQTPTRADHPNCLTS